MEYLSWDLAILSRAIAFNNLSNASTHVGLSQPQLSRIVAKLEEQLKLTLLDRETKRKSSWTPAAYKLAEIYNTTFHQFRLNVNQLQEGTEPDHIRVATLEGLVQNALGFCLKLHRETAINTIELNLFDLNVLEEKFLKNEIDLVFTSREPGLKKFKNMREIGYQTVDMARKGEPQVYSSFEFASKQKGNREKRTFVSNSLKIRLDFMAEAGGTGSVPSAVRPKKTGKENEVPVLAIAHDHLAPTFWSKISGFLK